MDLQREDNILFEKINSVRDLPNSVRPNLNLKWKVIEEGLETASSKPTSWMVAAVWLFIITFMGISSLNISPIKIIPKASVEVISKPENTKIHFRNSPVVKAPKINFSTPRLNMEESALIAIHPDTLSIKDSIPLRIVETVKPKKRRFKTMEFGEALPTSDTFVASNSGTKTIQWVFFPQLRSSN